jgi:protocatechuate 3,4-dioxygenase beta subunit
MALLDPVLFSRRAFLLSGFATLAWSQTKTPGCALAPEQEEGPYYLEDRLVRREIAEGRPGVPLTLRLALVDAKSCRPLPHAAIDIWHCDALGVYSGFTAMRGDGPPGGPPPGGPPPRGVSGGREAPPGPPPGSHRFADDTRYLRGTQITDEQGRVEFATLYPGWYLGRTTHIHLKVHAALVENANEPGGRVCHTGQLFFPEDVTADVAGLEPYATRLSVHRTLQSEDGVFRRQHGSASMLALTRLDRRTNALGFLAAATVAVDPDATPSPVGPFGAGGFPATRPL